MVTINLLETKIVCKLKFRDQCVILTVNFIQLFMQKGVNKKYKLKIQII